MRTFTMASGYDIPAVGTGTNTFGKKDGVYSGEITMDTTELDSAIRLGYRLIDTAVSYRNEAVVGKAVSQSGVPRSEFFITTKIPGTPEYTRDEPTILSTLAASLRSLHTGYIDLLLIHHPWDDREDMARVWRVLETLVADGKIRSIGVSNFLESDLTYLMQNCDTVPAVNQIESHPGHWNDDIIEFCLSQGIVPQAWGPLTRVPDSALASIKAIAQAQGKSWAQIVLSYQISRGVSVIPKSHNEARQKQNLDIFDIDLSDADKDELRALN